MVEFFIGVFKVIAGVMTISAITHSGLIRGFPVITIGWYVNVGVTSFLVFAIHRWIGSGVDIPFWTTLLHCVSLYGVTAGQKTEGSETMQMLLDQYKKNGIKAAVVGSLIGLATYGQAHFSG